MDNPLDQPAVVLVLLSMAAALFVIEVALPTAGIAGTLALLLAVVALVAIDQQNAEWWPLLGPILAVVLWAVMVARRQRSRVLEPLALLLFAAGSVGFGLLADSLATAIVGLVITAALAVAFPALHRAALRLFNQPAQVGMEALVGVAGVVTAWEGLRGTVRLQGSLWTATSREPVAPGDEVTVSDFAGMTITVVPLVHPQAQEA